MDKQLWDEAMTRLDDDLLLEAINYKKEKKKKKIPYMYMAAAAAAVVLCFGIAFLTRNPLHNTGKDSAVVLMDKETSGSTDKTTAANENAEPEIALETTMYVEIQESMGIISNTKADSVMDFEVEKVTEAFNGATIAEINSKEEAACDTSIAGDAVSEEVPDTSVASVISVDEAENIVNSTLFFGGRSYICQEDVQGNFEVKLDKVVGQAFSVDEINWSDEVMDCEGKTAWIYSLADTDIEKGVAVVYDLTDASGEMVKRIIIYVPL